MLVPVIIVSGFLGCGKTSFLRRLLPLCGEVGKRPALIVNEVGDVDVDGELLADVHAEQVRLVGGCVCCTLQSQLTQTVWDVLEREVYDLIIIECSGLSNPLDVVSALSAPALVSRIGVSHIISLVDAGRAPKVLAVDLARTQVGAADVVVLNEIDMLADEDRNVVEEMMAELGGRAARHSAVFGDIGRDAMCQLLEDQAKVGCACGCGHHHHAHSHSLPASFCTVALRLPESVERSAIGAVMAGLPENVVRAKGFANVIGEGWQVLHRVYDSVDVYPLTGDAPSAGAVLICIGQHLVAEEIRHLVVGGAAPMPLPETLSLDSARTQ